MGSGPREIVVNEQQHIVRKIPEIWQWASGDAGGIMVLLVEVPIPEVAAREIPRSHQRNQTIGAHGYRKQTVLKRTDEKSKDRP